MDEVIEAIVNYAIKKSEGFSFSEQSFIVYRTVGTAYRALS